MVAKLCVYRISVKEDQKKRPILVRYVYLGCVSSYELTLRKREKGKEGRKDFDGSCFPNLCMYQGNRYVQQQLSESRKREK